MAKCNAYFQKITRRGGKSASKKPKNERICMHMIPKMSQKERKKKDKYSELLCDFFHF